MTQIKLLDTGYLSDDTLTGQTQAAVANRAGYDGSANVVAFAFNTQTLSRQRTPTFENKPVITNFDPFKSSLISINNQTIGFTIVVPRSTANSSAVYGTNYLTQLLRMEKTPTKKLLYVDSVATELITIVQMLGAGNINSNFANASPSDNNGTVGTTIPYLVGLVRFGSINDSQANRTNLIIPVTFEVST